jgi:hypothetical protein
MLRWFSRKAPMPSVSIIDASTIYGAGRYYFGDHKKEGWAYVKQFKAAEDQLLFEDFLHNLLLYDIILIDNTSITNLDYHGLE